MNAPKTPFLITALLAATAARAQDNRTELVRGALIHQAEAARAADDHTYALDRAARAGEIRMTPSLRLLIASEHNVLGHTLDALEHAERCVREAEADAGLRNRALILSRCNALAGALRGRVGRVVVRVPDPVPDGLEVRLQGGVLLAATWGVAVSVMPGAVLLEASAADGGSFRQELTVPANETREVRVALARERVAPRHTGGGAAPGGVGSSVDGRPTRGAGVGPWVVAGLGLASLGAAAAFGVLRADALGDRAAHCDDAARVCDPSALDAQARAETMTTLVNVALGFGGAAVAGGALWWLLARAPAEGPPRHAWSLQVTPGAQGLSLSVGGRL